MIRDRKYLNFLHFLPCALCGLIDETIVGHHIRKGTVCGTGIKPSDNFAIPVCSKCHNDLHTKGEETTLNNCKYEYTVDEIKHYALQLYKRYCENMEKEK